MIDGQTRLSLRRAIETLERELASECLHGDEASQKRTELARIQAHLRQAGGIGGRNRRLGDDGERARKAVASAIHAALMKISATNPALAEHLRASIATGRYCKYQPVKPLRWIL